MPARPRSSSINLMFFQPQTAVLVRQTIPAPLTLMMGYLHRCRLTNVNESAASEMVRR